MIVRHLTQIQILPGPTLAEDRIVVVVRAFDDSDSEIEVTRVKELNVGAQLRDALDVLVPRVLEKASSGEKPVVRPTQVAP